MRRFIKSVYFRNSIYYLTGAEVALLVCGFFFEQVFDIAQYCLVALAALLLADITLLFRSRKGIHARRDTLEKLSNGDENEIQIMLENFYPFRVNLKVLDELPFQFQKRDLDFKIRIEAGQLKIITYKLRPVKRGEYHFGAVNVFASSPLGLVERRFRYSQDMMVPVYPSFMQMRKYELLAISNRLTEYGIKKIRRIGHTTEFEQIKEYVAGDDYRTINWRATARKSKLMVNQYTDERSQQVYSIIDMGRVMKMPFEGLSLLDYAINTSLVISNIAMHKQDKAGIITFSNKVHQILPAGRMSAQLRKIMELLYKQKTGYLESSFEALYVNIKHKINQRSLLLLYTNFESLSALKRQIKYLRSIANNHLLVVIFFENTELRELLNAKAIKLKDIYKKTIAEKFDYEKTQLVSELKKYGIHSILTAPEKLSVNTINKYLELKSRGFI